MTETNGGLLESQSFLLKDLQTELLGLTCSSVAVAAWKAPGTHKEELSCLASGYDLEG